MKYVERKLPLSFSQHSSLVRGVAVESWSRASAETRAWHTQESPRPAANKIVRAFSLLLKTNPFLSEQELATSILIV